MFQRFRTWKKHHSIEFFGATLAILLSLLFVDVAGILMYTANADRDYLSGTPYYAEAYSTSLSGLNGRIVGFYTNEDNTRVGIMLHTDNIANMSTDALQYEVYFRGFNVSKGDYTKITLNNPSGGYYVFGNTGYSMIYLIQSGGFKEQAAEIIVRSNETVVEGQGSGDAADEVAALKQWNKTFEYYDQFRLIVNPSATGATKVDFLDSKDGNVDVMAAYRYCVLDAEEDTVRQKLYNDVAQLNTYMRQINAYKKSLEENMGVRVPALPAAIAGDRFVNCPETAKDESGNEIKTPCELDTVTAIPAIVTGEDGSTKEVSYPVYIANYVYPRGVDFDWMHHKLSEGNVDFFDGLLATGQTKERFLRNLPLQEMTNAAERLDVTMFRRTDGTPLDANINVSTMEDDKRIYEAVTAYITAVNSYQQLKQQYQTGDLVAYLTLQYNMEVSGQSFTSNFVDGVINVW